MNRIFGVCNKRHENKIENLIFYLFTTKSINHKTSISQIIMSNTPARSMTGTPVNSTLMDKLHEILEITTKHHTFKQNPNRKTGINRRYKPSRQLISDEIKYLQAKTNLKFDTPTYTSITAPPSLLPRKHYCDITGLPSNYKSPSNQLRFYNSEIYQEVIKNLAPGVDQEYLQLRGANVVLK